VFMNNFYSRTISDLFAEFVDHVRAVVSIGYQRPKTNEHILQLADELQTQGIEMKSAVGELIAVYILSTYSSLAGKIERETQFTRNQLRLAATIIMMLLRPHGGKIRYSYCKFTGYQNYRSAFRGFSGNKLVLYGSIFSLNGGVAREFCRLLNNLYYLLAWNEHFASTIHDVSSTIRKTEYIVRNDDSKSAVFGS